MSSQRAAARAPRPLRWPRGAALGCAVVVGCTRAEVRREGAATAPLPHAASPSRATRGATAGAPAAPPPDVGAPAAWSEVAPGVRYRTARLALDDAGPLAWIVVRLDLGRVVPSARAVPSEHVVAAGADPLVLVAVDAGFFDDAHRPAGTLIVRNQTLAGPSPHGGSGTLLVREGRADVIDAALPIPRDPPVDLAVQCGPRLIDPDGDAGVYRDDGRRFARTAACVRDGGRTLDLIATYALADPMRGPGLYAFARQLVGPSPVGDAAGCERALNLDGGPSTGVFVRGAPEATHDSIGPVPYAIVVAAAPARAP